MRIVRKKEEVAMEAFGYELILDLGECDKKKLTSKEALKQYVDELCELIEMKKYGPTIIEFFGEGQEFTKGYSLVQLIETSCISGHFSEHLGACFINIFSCKEFDEDKAMNFSKKFFGAKKSVTSYQYRGVGLKLKF